MFKLSIHTFQFVGRNMATYFIIAETENFTENTRHFKFVFEIAWEMILFQKVTACGQEKKIQSDGKK